MVAAIAALATHGSTAPAVNGRTQQDTTPTENEMTHHAVDTLTDPGLHQEVRAAAKWLNDLSAELCKRGLISRLCLATSIRIG